MEYVLTSEDEDEAEEEEEEEEEEEYPSWQFGEKEEVWNHKRAVKGKWDETSSGGNMDHGSWRRNPQFSKKVKGEGQVKVTLRQSHPTPREDENKAIGFWILRRAGLDGCNHMRFVSYHSSNFVAASQFSSVHG